MKNLLIYALVILLAVSFLRMSSFSNNNQQQVEIVYGESYSEFVKGVESGNVKDVYITTYDNYQTISGTTVDGKTFNMAINLDSGDLIDSLVESGVNVVQQETPEPSGWWSLLSSLLPILLMLGLLFFIMNQSQGGGGKVMQFSKSKAKVTIDDKNRKTFADVAGADEVKEELEEIVEFLKDPRKLMLWVQKFPKACFCTDLPEPVKPCWLVQ